ncbi:MAG: hypothetical protein AB7H71_04945 [Alphaproteobacteria bacterium]
MSGEEIRAWLVAASGVVSMLAVAIGIWVSLKDYRLKLKAETRLANSTQVELDIKLLTLFPQIMNIANGRGENIHSEKAIEILLQSMVARIDTNRGPDVKEVERIRNTLRDTTIFAAPVGGAAQDAAIAAIWALGKRHELLRPVSKRALESILEFRPEVARPYYEDLTQGRLTAVSTYEQVEQGAISQLL